MVGAAGVRLPELHDFAVAEAKFRYVERQRRRRNELTRTEAHLEDPMILASTVSLPVTFVPLSAISLLSSGVGERP